MRLLCFCFYFTILRRRLSIARAPPRTAAGAGDLLNLSGGTSQILFPQGGYSHTPIQMDVLLEPAAAHLAAKASSASCHGHLNEPTGRHASVGRPVVARPNLGYFWGSSGLVRKVLSRLVCPQLPLSPRLVSRLLSHQLPLSSFGFSSSAGFGASAASTGFCSAAFASSAGFVSSAFPRQPSTCNQFQCRCRTPSAHRPVSPQLPLFPEAGHRRRLNEGSGGGNETDSDNGAWAKKIVLKLAVKYGHRITARRRMNTA